MFIYMIEILIKDHSIIANRLIAFGVFNNNWWGISIQKFETLILDKFRNLKFELVWSFYHFLQSIIWSDVKVHLYSRKISVDLSEKQFLSKLKHEITGKMHFIRILRLSSFRLKLTKLTKIYIIPLFEDCSTVLLRWTWRIFFRV